MSIKNNEIKKKWNKEFITVWLIVREMQICCVNFAERLKHFWEILEYFSKIEIRFFLLVEQHLSKNLRRKISRFVTIHDKIPRFYKSYDSSSKKFFIKHDLSHDWGSINFPRKIATNNSQTRSLGSLWSTVVDTTSGTRGVHRRLLEDYGTPARLRVEWRRSRFSRRESTFESWEAASSIIVHFSTMSIPRLALRLISSLDRDFDLVIEPFHEFIFFVHARRPIDREE